MSRIFVAIISILGSVMLYLCLRALTKYNIDTKIQNAVMFIPAAIVFGIWWYMVGQPLRIGRDMFLLMIPVCILCSWLPNLMSLKSMKLAPNIWYSLMISKSYVVITAIIAVPLLGSVLHWIDILAIAIIIWFMSLILIEPKKSQSTTTIQQRLLPSVYACIWRAWLALASAWFIKQWISPLVINFWIFTIVSVIILVESIITSKNILPPRNSWLPTLWVIIAMVVFNRSLQTWYAIAPNPGYINAANASSIALLTLMSSWIFKDDLSIRKIIGIVGVVIGIGILFIL